MKYSFLKAAALCASLAVSGISSAAFAGNPTDFGPYTGHMTSSNADCGQAGQKACTFGELKFGGDNVGAYAADKTAANIREDAGCGHVGQVACTFGDLKFGSDDHGPYGAN